MSNLLIEYSFCEDERHFLLVEFDGLIVDIFLLPY